MAGFDEGQARPHHGGSRTAIRLPGELPRNWRTTAPSLPSPTRATPSASALAPLGRTSLARNCRRLAMSTDIAYRRRLVFRDAGEGMGHDRLRGPRDRLLRQVAAQGPLCGRDDARQFLEDHGDLRLLLHRGRPARGEADAGRRVDPDADLWRLDPGHAQSTT